MSERGDAKDDHRLPIRWRWIILVGSLLGCVACASVFDPEVRKRVDPGLSYANLAADPTAYVGKVVILAGTVIEATNLKDGTRLTILQYPTGRRDSPRTDQASGGRFLIRTSEYLETALYRPGRAVSVIGEIQGEEKLPLGETHYAYPVVTPRELYLWQEGYHAPRFHFGFGFGISKGF